MLRHELDMRGMLQKNLAAAAGMTQPQVSRRLSGMGGSIPLDQLDRMCKALGMDTAATFEEATRRADAPSLDPATNVRMGTDADQIDALGRHLAEVMWNSADDSDFTNFAIDHIMDREDTTFWDARKKQLVLMVALTELAYAVGRRYPIRDKFILKQKLSPEEIVR
jgi:transcriptional regulator with XRE-family HTH domain